MNLSWNAVWAGLSLASFGLSLYVYLVGKRLFHDAIKILGTKAGNCSNTDDAGGDVIEVSNHVRLSLNRNLGIDLSNSEARDLTHSLIGILVVRTKREEEQQRNMIAENRKKRTAVSKRIVDSTRSVLEQFSVDNSDAILASPQETTPLLSLPPIVYLEKIIRSIGGNQIIPLMVLDNHSLLPNVLKFMHFDDLNNLAVCNRRLKELRADPSLDQTRCGVLCFCNDTSNSLLRLNQAIETRNLAQVFQGNRTCLQLKGFVQHLDDVDRGQITNQLPEVTRLLLVHERSPKDPYVRPGSQIAYRLTTILPNITHLDCSFAKDRFMSAVYLNSFEKLVSWTCQDGEIDTLGCNLRDCKSIRNLYLEDSPSSCIFDRNQMLYGFPLKMERLDIRRVRGYNAKDISALLNRNKNLRWVRCDVSDQERATLLAQKPNVSIVNW